MSGRIVRVELVNDRRRVFEQAGVFFDIRHDGALAIMAPHPNGCEMVDVITYAPGVWLWAETEVVP